MPWPSISRHARGYNSRWVALRLQALRRDAGLCQRCARANRVKAGNEVHHVKPKADGGTDDMSNLETLCHACHEAAGAEANGRTVTKRYRVALDGTLIEC